MELTRHLVLEAEGRKKIRAKVSIINVGLMLQ